MNPTQKTTQAQFVRDLRAAEAETIKTGRKQVVIVFFSSALDPVRVSHVVMATLNRDGAFGLVSKAGAIRRDVKDAFNNLENIAYTVEPYKF